MLIHNAEVTGSLKINNVPFNSGSFSGSFRGDGSQLSGVTGASTASYVEYNNVGNKPALVSSSAQIVGYGIFATTGSNSFNGSQVVTGSLTVTGQVVAQTLNVQQVTSSIVYSSGSNVFGNSLANTQQFTGSVSVTGSLTVNGVNYLPLTGGTLTGALSGTTASFTGNATTPITAINTGQRELGLFRTSLDGGFITFQSSGSNARGYIGNGAGISSLGETNFGIRSEADLILMSGGNNVRLTIASSTGAATFSSSVTAINAVLGNTSNNTNAIQFLDAASSKGHIGSGFGATFINNNSFFNGSAYVFDDNTKPNSQITLSAGTISLSTGAANTDPTAKVTILNNGNVGIGTTSPSSLLEVAGGGVFSLQLSGNLTDATRKFAFIQGKHYTNSEEPIAMIGIDSQASVSTLYIGGGLTSGLNAATQISFQTGATNTTLTGTERMNISSGGLVTVTGTGAGATSEGIFFKRTSNLAQGGYISGNGGVLNIVAIDEPNSVNGTIYFQRHNGTTTTPSMVINSSGNVGIGRTDPGQILDIVGTTPIINIQAGANNNARGIQFNYNGAFVIGSFLSFGGTGENALSAGATGTSGYFLTLKTDGAERMRITPTGFLKVSNNGTYINLAGPYHEFINDVTNNNIAYFYNTSASPYGPYMRFSGAAPNNGTNYFLYFDDNAVSPRFVVYSNGGISNYQANNVNLSDERTKKDIAPLESYWDKFKAIEIVKFKYKDQTHDDYNIGVIAQQVEQVAPEFVDIDGWDNKAQSGQDGNANTNEQEPMKSIYTADLYHATIKVLQEAMAKIESLETENDNLKSILQRNNIS
jgi:hypothetical protein